MRSPYVLAVASERNSKFKSNLKLTMPAMYVLKILKVAVRIELTNRRFAITCLTAWLCHPELYNIRNIVNLRAFWLYRQTLNNA